MNRKLLRLPLLWGAACAVLAAVGPRPEDLPAALPVRGWAAWATADPEHALVTLAGVATWLLLAWLALGAATVVVGRGTGVVGAAGRRIAEVLLPRVVRDGLAVALGLSVVVGSAGAAAAAPVVRPPVVATSFTAVPSLDRSAPGSLQLSPLPAVPPPVVAPSATASAAPSVAAAPRPARGGETPTEVVVHRGDCLWSVVARHLGPTATDDEIARAWPAWYAANRAVIGSDPALLLPGQRLLAPSPP